MESERIGQRLDQLVPSLLDESFHLCANRGVVHRPPDLVIQLVGRVDRPPGDIKPKPLGGGTFLCRHSDVREDFESLDVNPILHEIQCGRNRRPREPKAVAAAALRAGIFQKLRHRPTDIETWAHQSRKIMEACPSAPNKRFTFKLVLHGKENHHLRP